MSEFPNNSLPQENPSSTHAFDNEVISWFAPLYLIHEKTKLWYIIAGIILASFVIYGAYTEAWTFVVALITAAYVYIYSHRREAKSEKIIISELGIKEGPNFFPFSDIKGFWINYRPPTVKQLHLHTNRKVLPEVVIQLGDQDPVIVRNFLCSEIPEFEGQQEPLIDALARHLKL